MGEWPAGISTGCFYQTKITECLSAIRNAGFSMIEICSYPAHLDYHDQSAIQQAAEMIRGLGLEAYSFHAPFADHIDVTSNNAEQRQRSIAEMLTAAQAAGILGARHFVIHPGPEAGHFNEGERFQRMENAASAMNKVARRCAELGMGLVLENMLPHLSFGRTRDLLWVMGSLETTNVGICLDTGHAFLSGDLSNVAHKLSGHLWIVHASDNRGQFDDHLPPGDGSIPWEHVLRQLDRSNFAGSIILEIAGNGNPEQILSGAQRGRTYLRELWHRISTLGAA
jgi:sugar phosphate isomerase/epimerase